MVAKAGGQNVINVSQLISSLKQITMKIQEQKSLLLFILLPIDYNRLGETWKWYQIQVEMQVFMNARYPQIGRWSPNCTRSPELLIGS